MVYTNNASIRIDRRGKALLLLSSAALVCGSAIAATDQKPITTEFSRADIASLRALLDVQTQRLDQTEALLTEQQKLIVLQNEKIAALEVKLANAIDETTEANRSIAELLGGEWYAAANATGVHVVKPGDTLFSIAKRMGVSVDTLASANNIEKAHEIRVGQVINNPAATSRLASVTPHATPTEHLKAKPEEKATRIAINTKQPPPGPSENPAIQENALNQQRRRKKPEEELPSEVGVRPDEEDESPYLAIFSDVGGILTPKGRLYAEPSVSFTASSDNRFFFEGVEILDAILIGAIEATNTDRLAITENLGLRYGLTNRLEIDASIPYVYREDRISGVAIDDMTQVDDARYGSGLGDLGLGVHYQLNKGTKWPYLVANLRAKAPTGNGPFDVDRAANGQETELATGSGFWSVEPSLSFVLPSDPAVIFGSIGYQRNFGTSPNVVLSNSSLSQNVSQGSGLPPSTVRVTDTSTTITDIKPGDAISASLGVGLSLNERLSINLGYSHRYFFATNTTREFLQTITDTDLLTGGTMVTENRQLGTLTQSPSTVGNLLFGGSYSVGDRTRLNLSTSFGATDEAPDFRVSLRAQIKLYD